MQRGKGWGRAGRTGCVRAPAGFDGADALGGKGFVAHEELLIFAGRCK